MADIDHFAMSRLLYRRAEFQVMILLTLLLQPQLVISEVSKNKLGEERP